MKRPLIIGLTGSIGMGKSTTADIFREFGVPVWSADDAVHRLYQIDGAGTAEIKKICPEAVAAEGVDRDVLSSWISKSSDNLALLEARIHPLVRADREHFIGQNDAEIVLLDIPLLFETGGDDEVDKTVVVSIDREEQRRRVLSRPGMTEARLKLILERQMPDEEKRRRADFVIRTTTLDDVRASVENILKQLGYRGDDA